MVDFKEMLEAKENRFNEISALIEKKAADFKKISEDFQKEVASLENEQIRLQGEYNAIVEIMNKMEEATPDKNAVVELQ